jgi:hypothetical protein
MEEEEEEEEEEESIPNAHEDTQVPAGPSWICRV